MSDEKRMIENFEIKSSFWIGGHEIVIGVDQSKSVPNYLIATCVPFPEFGVIRYEGAKSSEDYLEVLSEFVERVQTELDRKKQERQVRGIGHTPFTVDDCIPIAWDDNLEGHMLVIDPKAIRAESATQDYQLIIATGGFGCQPKARGRTVIGVNLFTGDSVRWERSDMLGFIKKDRIPQWAKETAALEQEKNKHKRREHER